MALVSSLVWSLLGAGALTVATTQILTRRVEARFPPEGSFVTVDGTQVHYFDDENHHKDAVPVIFLHGAGGNARDLRHAMRSRMGSSVRSVFVDRPGAGYSERTRPVNNSLGRQAKLLLGFMDRLAIDKAILVGHSLGSAVALAMALRQPQRLAGMVLVAPASHSWGGGGVTWYYRIARIPVLGRLFIETVTVPLGHLLYSSTVKRIFEPDSVPPDYDAASGTRLILRPRNFRHNASDIGSLDRDLLRQSKHYREISVPTLIVTGDKDRVLTPRNHALKLADEIPGARLIVLPDTGHMPLHTKPELLAREIDHLASVKVREMV